MFKSLAIIALLPLFGSACAYLVGRFLNKHLAGWIASFACVLSFVCTINAVTTLNSSGVINETLFNWFSVSSLQLDFAFRLDQLNAVMCLVVTGIGSLIHFYSIAYMSHDESSPRFFAYLNLFMFSMLLLVLGANMLVLFVGWEGVGLCSYLLIGFWFKNLAYSSAGRKAFVVNRIGDAGFLIAMFLIFKNFGTLDFVQLANTFLNPEHVDIPLITLITVCLFVGAAGKSAQIPLFVWLPDAMAGPTPVSALIHAATMVTAGVYMLARLNFIFVLAPLTLAIIMVIATLTAFVAATTALTQYDIKKVLAYSTVSQLGFMFLACASGAFWVAIFHVVTHAFFKACLFLGAGSVIHGCHHEQDMRHMGGLASKMPITFATYLISTIAIAGIFPFAGYQSKHAILAALSHDHNHYLAGYGEFIYLIVSITAFLTAFYMMRSVMMTFFGTYKGHAHPHESPILMTLPLVILSALALLGGLYLAGPLGGYELLQNYLAQVLPAGAKHAHESALSSILHSWVGIAGVLLAVILYSQFSSIPGKILSASGPIGKLFQGKYFFDEIYGAVIVRPLEGFARLLWKDIDQSVIDGAVNGTAALVDVNGELARYPHTGRIGHYAFFMFVASVLLLVFCFWIN